MKTSLNAGTTSITELRYLLSKKYNTLIKNNVKILNSRSQSAGVCKLIGNNLLFNSKLNFGNLTRTQMFNVFNTSNIRQFSLTASQRLNAKNMAWLVGFVEGDGWFSVTKNGNYCKYEFGIEVSQRDIQLLYKIKILLGAGTVSIRKTRDTALFRISSKKHLRDIILPIFDYCPMFTTKHWDYINFKENLMNNVVYYKDLKPYLRTNNLPFKSVDNILTNPNFDNWLVGFIEASPATFHVAGEVKGRLHRPFAEGCFSFYKPLKEINYTASFDVCQTNGLQVLTAIKTKLNLKSNVNEESPNHFRLKTTSIEGIQNIINFLNKAEAKLRGYKRLQYLLFLKHLRVNMKYNTKLIIPVKYGNN